MAKVKKFPSEAVMGGLKKILDFYYWNGIPCVRSWPRSPGHRRAEAVEAQWPAWSFISKAWSLLPPELQSVYKAQASGTNLTGRDLFIKSYFISSSFVRI